MNLTVGICAYNEGLNIGFLLNNILYEQCISNDLEVLVVCSGCTDNTVSVVKEYVLKDPRVIIHTEEERHGKASAINYILKKARGNTIVFVSADVLPHQGCISQLLNRLENQKIGIVCARDIPINNTHSLVDNMVKIFWDLHDYAFKQLSKTGIARHASEIFCIRRGIIGAIPSDTINDDAYIAVSAWKKGWQICYEPKSCLSMRGPATIADYFRQRRRVIYGHRQIKKLTGEAPQYYFLFTQLNQKGIVRLILGLIHKYGPAAVFTFIWIELASNITGIFDSLLRKTQYKWAAVPSTKRILPFTINNQNGRESSPICGE